ncbi:hypothetical protein D910_10091 [Dendroctonus ponderosae]|uniref:Uncharacterized protein n=1 Tax=Dendroctonus ponderosae TaxID=77166 RepID=U4UJW0_DENPD|nr:hypothetical protein D910_10091 [Dendroctonus ponderosae]
MSGPNFAVKVPWIPVRPKSRREKAKKSPKACDLGLELETIVEARPSKALSFYNLKSPPSSSSGLNVLETYQEYLNLKDLDSVGDSIASTNRSGSDRSVFCLKQICPDATLMELDQPQELQTAIIARRIAETEKQVASSRKSSKNSLRSQPLSGLTSRYLPRPKFRSCELQVKVEAPQRSCSCQTSAAARSQQMQVQQADKSTATPSGGQQEQSTQMYEHITENDLLCLEWINKNLFKVPINPHHLIVDEKLKESSEFTCFGTNTLEQELNWELQALCM